MPPYTSAQLTALKRELLAVASADYRLTDAAVERLRADTGLTIEQIRRWAKDVLTYYETDGRRRRFLAEDKVRFNFFQTFQTRIQGLSDMALRPPGRDVSP